MKRYGAFCLLLLFGVCTGPEQTAGGRAAPSPNAFVTGQAVYEDGTSAAGAGVFLRNAGQIADGTDAGLPQAVTDAAGIFGFPVPRDNTYMLETADSTGLKHLATLGPDDLTGDTCEVFPVLRQAGAIAGTIIIPDSVLAAGLFRISVRGLWESTVPDSSGGFLLSGLPVGTYILRIDAPYATGQALIQILELTDIAVTSAGTTDVGSIQILLRTDLAADSLFIRDSLAVQTILDMNNAPGAFEEYTAVLNGRIVVFADENGFIDTLPATVGQLDALEILMLHNGGLSDLPSEVGNLFHLIRLDLVNQNLGRVPTVVTALTSLVELNLISCGLDSLPTALFDLTALQYLSVRDNHLTALSDDLDRLLLVKNLDLSGNDLSSLPVTITGLSSLQTISITDNNICSLPDSILIWLEGRQHDWQGSQCP